MAFKTKTKNRLLIDERQTLDAKHNNILNLFTETKYNVNQLYDELSKINEQINLLNIENAKLPILNLTLQRKIWDYDDKKKILEKEIYRIENNIDENSYMLKTGKLLSNYYKIINEENNIAADNSESHNVINSNTNNTNIVFENSLDNIINETQSNVYIQSNDKINIKSNTKNDNKVCHFENENIVNNKDTIYDKYMHITDKTYININNENIDVFDSCPKCSVEMLLNNNTGQLICPKCGIIENIIVDSDKPSFKEPPKEMTSFCYKRINHLNEFLAQFQAKETTDIPEDVYNKILMEIKKERITNMAYITPEKMRILLKKIKKNDYYEHIPYIINQLNGLPAPVIAPEIEEIIRGMFKAIQIPFEKYCPFKRKNFLSYNYVMYKFFELLELDEYLNCFQLLKSRTKLHQQDQIWKNICKDLNWEYINSL